VRELVVDSVCPPFREQRRAVELDEFLFHHPPHQVGGIDLVNAVAELAVKAIRIEQSQEQLKVLFLSVVRRGRHQQQMPCLATEAFGKPVSPGLFELGAEEMGCELMRFVEDDQIPSGGAELRLKAAGNPSAVALFFVASELVESHDQ